ncbi:MAG: hypothetical protein J5726_08855 [Treponema sp.]|nr:hypothetical protein [Treponema sp.]
MKLDPIFTVKNNQLYKIDDNSQVDPSTLKQLQINWSTVELADEQYNEEYLAGLRDQLKAMEDAGEFAVLVPVVDKPLETAEQTELFINAFNHTARRVKDCASVAGFELPEALISKGFEAGTPAADFMETLAIKHAQYVYFVKAAQAPKNIATY